MCQPTAGHDAVHVRMVRQRRAPGVQHQRGADPGAQVLRIGGDGQQHLGGQVEQQAIEHRLVLVSDVRHGRRQREYHVVILHRQQIGLARVQPALCRRALALGAVPVAAGVVGDLVGTAALAAQHVSSQRRAAALFDGRHDLELAQAQVVAQGGTPGRTVLVEDIGRLQGWPSHGCTSGRRQRLQRADHLAQQIGGHVGVDRRRLQPLVTQ